MPAVKAFLAALVFLFLAFFFCAQSLGATRTWTGNTDGVWGTGNNWSGTSVPTSLTPVVFTNAIAGRTTLSINASANAKGITFQGPAAGSFTIGGASTLTIGSGGIANSSG